MKLEVISIDSTHYEESGKEILRELRVVQGQMPVAHRQTSKANAIYGNRLFIVLTIPAHREAHKDQIKHVANTVEWKAQCFLPNRVEAVVLD
jgi:hypothetical protein